MWVESGFASCGLVAWHALFRLLESTMNFRTKLYTTRFITYTWPYGRSAIIFVLYIFIKYLIWPKIALYWPEF